MGLQLEQGRTLSPALPLVELGNDLRDGALADGLQQVLLRTRLHQGLLELAFRELFEIELVLLRTRLYR